PRFFYLEYHEYRNYFPLMAMSRYRNLRRNLGLMASGYQKSAGR
ncbi:MAG: hypothetical protein ACK4WF_04390, partial [Candidatus Brocadiales bacterium]